MKGEMQNTQESIFSQVRREQPERVVWENENYFALRDIRPQAEVHLLVIPKKEVTTLPQMSTDELGQLMKTATEVAEQFKLRAYQVQINVNEPYQEVFHVHVHIKSDYPTED